MKCPEGPSPRNSENHDSCSTSSFKMAKARVVCPVVLARGQVADVAVPAHGTSLGFHQHL